MKNLKEMAIDLYEEIGAENEMVYYKTEDGIESTIRNVGSFGDDEFENTVIGTINLSKTNWDDVCGEWGLFEEDETGRYIFELPDANTKIAKIFINDYLLDVVKNIIY